MKSFASHTSSVVPIEMIRTDSGSIFQKPAAPKSAALGADGKPVEARRDGLCGRHSASRRLLRKMRLSVRAAIVVLVTVCVVVSVMPQFAMWYVTALSSTHTAAEHLMRSITDASVDAFSSLASDAENCATELSNAMTQHPTACVPAAGGILDMWHQVLDVSRTGNRLSWYIGVGDRWNFHVGTYGAAPAGSYSRTDPVLYLQDPARWNGSLVSFYLAANATSGTWQVSDSTGEASSTYNNSARPWWQQAVQNPGQIRWGDVFVIVPEGYLVMSASTSWSPLGASGNGTGTPCGAVVAMMSLDAIGAHLRSNKAGSSDVWLVSDDDNSYIIASSTEALAGTADGNRIQIEKSEDALTRAVGKAGNELRAQGKLDTIRKVKLLGKAYDIYAQVFDLRPGTGFPKVAVYVAVPDSVYFGSINRNISTTIGVTAGMVAFCAIVSALVAVLISRPLRGVVSEMERASKLESAGRSLDSSRRDRGALTEISSIYDSMQKMWLLLASFHKYVPIEVLRLLQNNGEIARLGVTRRKSSIMFCDIENFTPLTEETADPAVLLQVLTEFMDICCQSIDESHGLVDKFIGDAVMAFWGHPGEETDISTRAVSAGLRILSRLAVARPRWQKRGLPQLNCRIGIATGDVLVGNSGSSNHFHYTVLGSSVNMAARLEPLNKAFGTHMLVDSQTWSAVSHEMVGRRVARCRVKGFSTVQSIYEVTSTQAEAGPELMEAMQAYNDAEDALEDCEAAKALSLLKHYFELRPDDAFAARQIEALENPQDGRSYTKQVMQQKKETMATENDEYAIDATVL